MGIIDPMAFDTMATTGVLEFGSAPILWAMTLGLLAAAAAAIAVSAWHPYRSARRAPRRAVRRQGAVMSLIGRAT